MNIIKICTLFIGLSFLGVVHAEDSPVNSPRNKVVVIPIKEEISKPELFILRRGLKMAIENQVSTVVIDMDTPGGALDVTFEMLKALEKFPGRTITYVNREAISAGALIAAGTDDIYFSPSGIIGAAAPVDASGAEIDTTMRKKIVSYLKARVRSISEGKGFRGDVVSAMIDSESEFKIGDQVIKANGELLSLTAQEAMKTYGDPPQALLGSGIAENLGSLLDSIHGADNYTMQVLEVTWSEKLAQYLVSLTPILLGIGLLALFIEFKTPGFGVFGISGIVILMVVFFGQFVAGLSGHEPTLFFLVGITLVLIDLFLIPGMILAMVGAILIFGSLIWAMTDLWPNEPLDLSSATLVEPLANIVIGTALAVVSFMVMLKFLPKGGLWGGMVLYAAVGGEPGTPRALVGGCDDDIGSSSFVGMTATAATALFPSGQIEIHGRRYEARLALGFADAGTSLIVTGTSEFGLIVEVLS